jgi:hypothetical protein
MMETGVGAAAIVTLNALVAVCGVELESFTWMVNENVPVWVGIPPICPVEVLSVSPGGKEPEVTDQEYGAVPPLAVSVAE